MGRLASGSTLFVTEAKGIQGYVLRTGKLKHVVGASRLVESLTGSYFNKIVALAGVPQGRIRTLQQAAGVARVVFEAREDAETVARVWPLAAARYAPGLEVVQAVTPCTQGLENALWESQKSIAQARSNPFLCLPTPGPLVRRVARDGLAAVDRVREPDGELQFVSSEIQAKLKASKEHSELYRPFVTPDVLLDRHLPRDFNQISGDERQYLGIVHADGNCLGNAVLKLRKLMEGDPCGAEILWRTFSEGLSEATREAVKIAVKEMVQESLQGTESVFPFKILVLAGDDLTAVVRGDRALIFVQRFLEEFRKITVEELEPLGFINGFTACAGIAFIKPSYPFIDGYQLAEFLCRHAKTLTRRETSGLSFYRQTASAPSSYDEILMRELMVGDRFLTMETYEVNDGSKPSSLPRISDLFGLVSAVRKMPRGSLRGLVHEIYNGPVNATKAFERIKEVCPDTGTTLEQALLGLTGNPNDPLWHRGIRNDSKLRTPLVDAMELHALETTGLNI